MELPKYIKGTALAAAVDAYDDARCAFHATEHTMSDGNKDTIAPMIMEAIVAWELATKGETDLHGGLLT